MGAHMTEVSCMGYAHRGDEFWRTDSRTGNLFSNEIAQFRMSNGAVARITEGRRIGHVGHEGAVRVLGTAASFERDTSDEYVGRWITRTSSEHVDPRSWREPLPVELAGDLGGHGGSHAYLVHEFVRACVEGRAPLVNAWQAARTVAAGVAAHKSALRDGELVKVVDFGSSGE